jgi:membrane protein implicated in regulation of membrane protease activity
VSPKIKYLLFQIPGWIITAIVLLMLLHWEFIPKWLAVLCFVAWLLKDLLLYPFLRRAYEPGVTGSARLVGSKGIAEGDLTPTGYIRVRGELWRAVASPADQVVRSGTEVEIVRAERMEVFVRAVNIGPNIRDAHSSFPAKLS